MRKFKKISSFLSLLLVLAISVGTFPLSALAQYYTSNDDGYTIYAYNGEIQAPNSSVLSGLGAVGASVWTLPYNDNFPTPPSFSAVANNNWSTSLSSKTFSIVGSDNVGNYCNVSMFSNSSLGINVSTYDSETGKDTLSTFCSPTVSVATQSGDVQTSEVLPLAVFGEDTLVTRVRSIQNNPSNVRVTVGIDSTIEAYGAQFQRVDGVSDWVGHVGIDTETGRADSYSVWRSSDAQLPQGVKIGASSPSVSSSVERPRNSDIIDPSVTRAKCTQWEDGNFWREVKHVYCVTYALSADGRTGRADYYDSAASAGWFQELLGIGLMVAGFYFGIDGGGLLSGILSGSGDFTLMGLTGSALSSVGTELLIAATSMTVAAASGASTLGTVESTIASSPPNGTEKAWVWTWSELPLQPTTIVTPISVNLTASPPGPLTAPGATTLSWTTTGNPDSCTASNFWSGAKTASGGSELRSGIPASTQIFDITCSKAGTANANDSVSVVVNPPAAPTGYVTPNSCTISSGGSSCAMNVVWGSSNTTGTVTVQRPYAGNSIFATGPSGNTPATFTPPGTYNLDLYDGTTYLATGSFIASCATDSTWNGSSNKCVANATSGTISASPNPCTVAIGGNTCSTNLTWNINAPNPNVYNGVSNIYTTASGNSQPATVAHNGTTFDARNSNSVLNSVTVTGTCVSGSGWNGSICSATPTATLLVNGATSATINSGQSATLTWSSTNATSCTAAGGFSTGNATWNSTGVSTGPLSSDQIYQISCTDGVTGVNSNIVIVTVINPQATISANPMRVSTANPNSQISWTLSQTSGCSITRNGAAWRSSLSSSGFANETITAQTTYVLTCPSLPTSSVTVNVGPDFDEF